MDQTDQLIIDFEVLNYPQISIETNFGVRYIADLKSFKKVFCFPKNQKEWEKVSITTSGFNLTWASRFELNVDQIISEAIQTEKIKFTVAI